MLIDDNFINYKAEEFINIKSSEKKFFLTFESYLNNEWDNFLKRMRVNDSI